MGLLLDGSRRMRFGAALGIRAGENPAAYGGVVQAASHDQGEGEARAHIREKQVRGLPPPNGALGKRLGKRMMSHDGCAATLLSESVPVKIRQYMDALGVAPRTAGTAG